MVFCRLGILASEVGELMPASLRGGGASTLYFAGVPLNLICWHGCWTPQRTLEFYIEEVAVTSIGPKLCPLTRRRIHLLVLGAAQVMQWATVQQATVQLSG